MSDNDAKDCLPAISERLANAYDPARFREFGHRTVDLLADYLETAMNREHARVLPIENPKAAFDYWSQRETSGRLQFIDDFIARSNHLHDPRYMGHQVAVPMLEAAIAGMADDLLNNGSAVYEMGTASVPIERLLMQTVGATLGLGESRGGILCHGGTLANAVALLAARQRKAGEDVWNEGQSAPLALLVSEQAHYCVDRIVRIMGWGASGLIAVPADNNHRMQIAALPALKKAAEAQGKQVVAIVGSACTTSAGAYDDLNGIADFAASNDLWFHVDGAHGAPAAFSARHRHLLAGMGRADSITMDFHKLMGLPTLCTGLFYQHESDSFAAFAQQADYLFSAQAQEWWELGKRTFECTRRALSLRIKLLHDTYGEALWGDLVDRLFGLASVFADTVEARNGWQLAMRPQANIVCFRHCPAGLDGRALDAHNHALRQRLLENGPHYIVQTRFGGTTWLRVTLMHPLTTPEDITALFDQLEALARV